MKKTYETVVYENVPQVGDTFDCIDLRPNAYGIETKRIKTKVTSVERIKANTTFGNNAVVKHYDHAYKVTSEKASS